jgi:hypothetical protein
MDEINISVNNFINSIENKENINNIQNNLSLLIGQINLFYYKYNVLNIESCKQINDNVTLKELDTISDKIRNIYPKFVELRKEQFKENYINKLNCDKKPIEIIDNITRTNKIQSMLTDLTELLYIFPIENKEDNKLSTGTILMILFMILIIFVIIIFIVIMLIKKNKLKMLEKNSLLEA